MIAAALAFQPVSRSAAEPGPQDTSKAFYADRSTYGWIPDESPSCGRAGRPLEVEFDVADLPARRITRIYVRLSLVHGALGDVDASLVAPDGTEHVLFADTGPQCDDHAGGPHLDGAYGFIDDSPRDWWSAAAALGEDEAMESEAYRTSDATGEQTSMVAGFADVDDPNGTWVLRLTDDWNGVRGHVTGAELGVTVDTTAPDTEVTGPENGATLADHPTYQLASPDDDAAGYRCQVNGSEPFPCTSPWTPVLRNGAEPHVVAIAAVDASGNADPYPEVRTFVLQDSTPPETTITSGPADQAVLTEPPTWEFTSAAPDLQDFWCSLDGAGWTTCPSPHTPASPGSSVLASGPHVWAVVAVDQNGNTEPTPEVRRFVLRDVACEDARAALEKAERRLDRAEDSGDRRRIRQAKRAVRRAERAVAVECADSPPARGGVR